MTGFNHTAGHTLDVAGAGIYFEAAGNPAGRPLVLLHGGLGCMMELNTVAERLSPRFRLIGIDLRGHGRSTLGDAGLSYARYQADVEAVLTHLNIDKYSILGFSDGGITGYRLALQAPLNVEKLIAVGAQWYLDPAGDAAAMLGGLDSKRWIDMFPESVRYYERVNPQPDFDRLVETVVAQVWMDTTETGYPQENAGNIESPVLLVRGDGDELFSLHEAAGLCSRLKEVHFLNIPFAGYEVHIDAPDVFIAAVDTFLSQQAETD